MAVEKHLSEGARNIALAFPPQTFPYSRLIAALIQCYEMVDEKGGKLAVIEPNEDFMSFFRMINLNNILTIFPSSENSTRDW